MFFKNLTEVNVHNEEVPKLFVTNFSSITFLSVIHKCERIQPKCLVYGQIIFESGDTAVQKGIRIGELWKE